MHTKSGAKRVNKTKVNKKDKKRSVFFVNLLIVVIVALCLIHTLYNFATVADRYARLETLIAEHNSVRIQNDALRDKLEKNRNADRFDEEYIISVARAHGLRKDSDIIFYLYSGE